MLRIDFGLPYGIKGVAIGYTIASNLWVIPLMYIVLVKLLKGKLKDFWAAIKKPVLFSALCSPIVYVLSNYVREYFSTISCLLITFFCSSFLYLLFLFVFEKWLFENIIKAVPFLNKKKYDLVKN